MNLREFQSICAEVFKIDKKTGRRAWFPKGCDDCANTDPEDCLTNCMWLKDNRHEKYAEVQWYYTIYEAWRGGFPVAEIDTWTMEDYVRLGIVRGYDEAGRIRL